jgi:hypothetical protein
VALVKTDALNLLSQIEFSPRCKQIADYWLSIWDGDLLPQRGRVQPVRIKSLLPGVILFDVVPNKSVKVRLAGTEFWSILKLQLTGGDWLAMTPLRDRAERLRIFSDVARGGIGFNQWGFEIEQRGMAVGEKLLLPLLGGPGDAAIPVLGFVDWVRAPEYCGGGLSLERIARPALLGPALQMKGGLLC